jgi:hypothetical protein
MKINESLLPAEITAEFSRDGSGKIKRYEE